MSAYPPPSENLPIFDSGLFGSTTDLTIDNLKSKFLTYPTAQSGLETIPNLAITSSGTAPTAGSSSNDTTIATTAWVKANGGGVPPLTPSPAGTYTNPSQIVVNSGGQITSASSDNTIYTATMTSAGSGSTGFNRLSPNGYLPAGYTYLLTGVLYSTGSSGGFIYNVSGTTGAGTTGFTTTSVGSLTSTTAQYVNISQVVVPSGDCYSILCNATLGSPIQSLSGYITFVRLF